MPYRNVISSMNLGELETEVLRKLWQDTQEDTDGFSPNIAFSKYSKYRVRKKINQAYLELATLARAIRSWFIITLKENYSQYIVPPNCFDIEDVYYFTSATNYEKFDVYEESYLEEELIPGWKTQPGVPAYAYVADRNKMAVKLGVAPAPNADGTSITLGSGLSQGATPYGSMEAVSGYAGPASATNSYVDSEGRNFDELGVAVGVTVWNTSDGSTGVVTSLASTGSDYDTIVCSAGLTGGSANVWIPGDAMQVLGGEYGGLILGEVDSSFVISGVEGGLPLPGITMAAGNVLVRGIMYPIKLQDVYQYPELSPVFHPYIALGAAALLGMEEPTDSPEFAQAKSYKDAFAGASALLATLTATQYKGSIQLRSKKS